MTNDDIKALAKQADASWVDNPLGGYSVLFVPSTLAEFVRLVRESVLDEAATFIEQGSFLHDQSPAKLFADQLAPKIRSLE